MFKPTQKFTPIKEDNRLEKAKEYPVQNLFTGELKKMTGKMMGCCPFHNETNPSFAIYTATNTWNCFAGCGSGDVISFYMKLHDVDFQTALEALS